MDQKLLNKIAEDTLSVPFVGKEDSDEFAGVFLHSNSPFTLKECHAPIHSFFTRSKSIYPLYLFISQDAITDDVKRIINMYKRVRVCQIPTLHNQYEFNNFSINSLLYWVEDRHNQLLYIQTDGWILKEGWEEMTKGYSWLGARWKHPIKIEEKVFNFPSVIVGNGGCNFRRRDKCLEVLELVNKNGGQKIVEGMTIHETPIRFRPGSWLAEDSFFSYFGFGSHIFESVTLGYVDKFAKEPITFKQYKENPSYVYHRIDQ